MHHTKNPASGGTLDGADCNASRQSSPYTLNGAKNKAPIAGSSRRLLARSVPTEPRRPRAADVEAMCAELPYGYWRDATGRLVVFNRRYRPLWQRLPDATIERAHYGEWVRFVEQRWFNWSDARYEKTARERLRQILRDFFAGKDLRAHTIITEWDRDGGPLAHKAVQP